MDYPEKVFITLFLSPKRYNLLNDIINYTFSGVFSFFICTFVPERVYYGITTCIILPERV